MAQALEALDPTATPEEVYHLISEAKGAPEQLLQGAACRALKRCQYNAKRLLELPTDSHFREFYSNEYHMARLELESYVYSVLVYREYGKGNTQ